MAPITLFDKSFLQSLTLDEAVLFDNFFYSNICPIFFVETLADLAKDVKGRTAEQEVKLIADKTPQLHGEPNMFHTSLCLGNLMGNRVTITTGQIVLSPAPPVRSGNKTGVVVKEPPETEALRRWQDGQFEEVERQVAKLWREALAKLDFTMIANRLNEIGINAKTCQSLEEAREVAKRIVSGRGTYHLIEVVMALQGVPMIYKKTILERWKRAGYPKLNKFAPYSSHILEIDIFFYVATAAKLLSSSDVNNRTDLAYLYYLPFCMLFVSSDTFHKRCTPLFLRPDQEFVWGPSLKAALSKLNHHYQNLSEEEKEKGLFAFAAQPPPDDDSLVTKLWNKFLRPDWRHANEEEPLDENKEKMLINQLKEMSNAPLALPGTVDLTNPDSFDYMVLKRTVQRRRGSYWQVPKDLKDAEED